MSLLAVAEFCRATVAASGTAPLADTQWEAIEAYRQRPKLQKLGSEVLVTVGNITRHTTRATMGRSIGGRKKQAYEVQLLIQAVSSDEQGGGDDFAQLVEQTSHLFELVPIPQSIADPKTAATYDLIAIGEVILVRILEPVATAPQASVTFTADITLTVEVWQTA